MDISKKYEEFKKTCNGNETAASVLVLSVCVKELIKQIFYIYEAHSKEKHNSGKKISTDNYDPTDYAW